MNNLRVLLVDDEPHVIDAMSSLLEQSDGKDEVMAMDVT